MTGLVLRRARVAGARPAAFLLLVAAGVSDLGTGLALVVSPGLVLALLGLGAPGTDAVYLRFVGAFVACVGAVYLYPWFLAPRAVRLATVTEVTAVVRGGIALFVIGAVASGALAPPWLLVAGFDGLLAAAQVAMLRRRWIGDGA